MAISATESDIRKLFPEVDQIEDKALRQGVLDIWIEVAKECAWTRFEDPPKNLDLEKNRRLIDHVRGVTRMALALAEIGEREHGAKYNRDNLLAACLLHDVSKLVESEPDPERDGPIGTAMPARKSPIGEKLQHAAYATHKVLAHGLPLEVAHLVLTHTHASNLRSKTIEASYLFYSDFADSDVGVAASKGKPFSAQFKLG